MRLDAIEIPVQVTVARWVMPVARVLFWLRVPYRFVYRLTLPGFHAEVIR